MLLRLHGDKMATIFISGSISIKKIDGAVLSRIDCIIEKNFNIIVGDADGIDLLIQKYLHEKKYSNVCIYCSGDSSDIRNNIGDWPIISVQTKSPKGTRDFYTAKDIQMSKDADYGLMIWNKKSPGTLSNVVEMIKQNKKSRVFLTKEKQFIRINEPENVHHLIQLMDIKSIKEADNKIKLSSKLNDLMSPELPF